MRRVHCKRKHRMVQIVDELWLCECSAYGRLVDRRGAVEEARHMVDRRGGIDAIRRLVEAQEEQLRKERQTSNIERERRLREAIRETA